MLLFSRISTFDGRTFTASIATQSSTLTDFPIYIDLENMPAIFWTNVSDLGENIRIYQSNGTTLIPHYVRVYKTLSKGAIWCKHTLSSSGTTEIVIKLTDDTSPLAINNANGRDNVFNDYEAFYLLGEDHNNYGSIGGELITVGDPSLFNLIETSSAVTAHQGVAVDASGTIFTIDTNAIRKISDPFGTPSVAETNSDPAGDVNTDLSTTGYDHCGDGFIDSAGKLYIPINDFVGTAGSPTKCVIAVYDTTLTNIPFVSTVVITAVSPDFSAFCEKDGEIHAVIYTPTTKIYLMNKTTGAALTHITLSTSIPQAQGIEWWRGAYWITNDAADETQRVELDGSVSNLGLFGQTVSGGNLEGLAALDADTLVVLTDLNGAGNGRIQKWRPHLLSGCGSGGATFPATSYLKQEGIGYSNVFSMSASYKANTIASQQALISVCDWNAAGNDRATLAMRTSGGDPSLSLWDDNNSWLEDSPTFDPGTVNTYRISATYNNTTDRKLWRDGALQATDNTITALTTAAIDFSIGTGDDDEGELIQGEIGCIYKRHSILSADWLAAEWLMLDTNNSFITFI